MAELDRYSPAQALARGLILCAVTGGSNHWARLFAVRFDCPPEQVFVEGVDIEKRLAWTIDLGDVQRAISKLIATPYHCARANSGIDPGLLRTVGETLADARRRQLSHAVELRPSPDAPADYDRREFEEMVADVVLQVAAFDRVSH